MQHRRREAELAWAYFARKQVPFFAPHGSVRPRTAAPPAPYAPRALPPPGRSPLRSRRARRLAHCLPAACPAACVAGQRRFGRERSRRRSREAAEACRSPRAPELAEPIITFATGPSAENDDLRQLARRRRRAASTLARRAGVESAVEARPSPAPGGCGARSAEHAWGAGRAQRQHAPLNEQLCARRADPKRNPPTAAVYRNAKKCKNDRRKALRRFAPSVIASASLSVQIARRILAPISRASIAIDSRQMPTWMYVSVGTASSYLLTTICSECGWCLCVWAVFVSLCGWWV